MYVHEVTAAGNRINNIITRFGLTAGRNRSIVRDQKIRDIVEDQISDDPSPLEGLCSIRIPLEVRLVLRDEYEKFDRLTTQTEKCKTKIFDKARSMQWETDTRSLPGDKMIRILTTTP